LNIVSDQHPTGAEIFRESQQRASHVNPALFRRRGRYAVNTDGARRDFEALRPNNEGLTAKGVAGDLRKYPRDLHEPGPITKVGRGGVVIVRQTRRLDVKKQVHRYAVCLTASK
jgi:hypothetical protein